MCRIDSKVFAISRLERMLLGLGEKVLLEQGRITLRLPDRDSQLSLWLWRRLKPLMLIGFDGEMSRLLVSVYFAQVITCLTLTVIALVALIGTMQPVETTIFILGMGIAITLYPLVALLEHHREAKAHFHKEFIVMLQHLAVMSGIGMHPQVAFRSWCSMPQKPVMRHMLDHVEREMMRGLTFYESWMIWQELLPERHIKRFIALMAQSARHGLGDISMQLWQIVEDIAIYSKLEVKRRAEQVSAKLLLPMMISLIALLFVMIYPAMQQLELF